jgi:hypothetical protein
MAVIDVSRTYKVAESVSLKADTQFIPPLKSVGLLARFLSHTAPPSESFQCFDYTPQSNVDGEARRHDDVRSSVVYAVTF